MNQVSKTYFEPLASTKGQVRQLLGGLPLGSAHPFSPEKILLCKVDNGIKEIDISSHSEDFFFGSQDLGEMEEVMQKRMDRHSLRLKGFEEYQILQAPGSTFHVPIVPERYAILSFSETKPTYYDLCFADAEYRTACWAKTKTLKGITHTGDLRTKDDLLQCATITKKMPQEEVCVFISGYNYTEISQFNGTHPALLVADHAYKMLYLIPVPLDKATIGRATICCPLVIKRDGDSLICSVLPTATTSDGQMCSGEHLRSSAFPRAIRRADFSIAESPLPAVPFDASTTSEASEDVESLSVADTKAREEISKKKRAIFVTNKTVLPTAVKNEDCQRILYGNGLEFQQGTDGFATKQSDGIVLPCILGTRMQGSILLATGAAGKNIPFHNQNDLHDYYNNLETIVVFADERMTDSARNVASSYRINALFIIQLGSTPVKWTAQNVLARMNSANINAITSLAGPLSLVLAQINERFYFYRGLGNKKYWDTTYLEFGVEVTGQVESIGLDKVAYPARKKVLNLDDSLSVVQQSSGATIGVADIKRMFEELDIQQIIAMKDDIYGILCQLQVLLDERRLRKLSRVLVETLTAKVQSATAPFRERYIHQLTHDYQTGNLFNRAEKEQRLGDWRRERMNIEKLLGPVISALADMATAQTTSRRTHDLTRLARKLRIRENVAAAKETTFETLAENLEKFAGEMGVLLINIQANGYNELLLNLNNLFLDGRDVCELDSRLLYLQGLDAGLIIEQSQSSHQGPLQNQGGATHPILAVPNLNKARGPGSMLAWVCWDEFVELESPYKVWWLEKCNDSHIATFRIVMRDTLSSAVSSRHLKISGASAETGHLMGVLLMATMRKLADMRTTAPDVVNKAEDTTTKLMRGLFGNLLTTAASGTQPMSMVWQLFSSGPQLEVPSTRFQWMWYETAVALYPYTGWPREQFHANLEQLLNKTIVRAVEKHEDIGKISVGPIERTVRYCRTNHIQLAHSRTILTILAKVLTEDIFDIAVVAKSLLDNLPETVMRQSQSYSKLRKYLGHLAASGLPTFEGNLAIARTYTKRSAEFAEDRKSVEEACRNADWESAKKSCQALIDHHAEAAAVWNLDPEEATLCNLNTYKMMLEIDISDETNAYAIKKLTQKVYSDAENYRTPWQISKKGKPGEAIEQVDCAFVQEILSPVALHPNEPSVAVSAVSKAATMSRLEADLDKMAWALSAEIVAALRKNDLSSEDACRMMNIPEATMRAFVAALQPEFVWEDLGARFKKVVMGLLKTRAGRTQSQPAKKLLSIVEEEGQNF